MSTMTLANHRSAAKPRRPGRLLRRPVARNGRHPAANRAATRATAATTGGQKIDYTRGRWPQIQFRRVGCTPPSSPNAARRRCDEPHPTKLTLTHDADGKSLVDLDLSTYPNEEGKALLKYEVVRSTGQTVATGTFATAPIVELTAPTPGDDAFYEFFAWLDKNNNGLRDAGEEVKTLGAQQAAHVITINPQGVNIPRNTSKTFTLNVKSAGKNVPNVALDWSEIKRPVQPGTLPMYSAIFLTDNNGNSAFTIDSLATTVQGAYAVSVYEGATYAFRVADVVLNFTV